VAEFEVVVVGGGAAGCVVARRLADRGRSVLLLEAGPDIRRTPGAALTDGWTIDREAFDWGYRSEGDGGESRPVWRKRALGGTSWLTRFTPRGAPADFDGWAARGNPGWAWEDVVEYFRRLETDVDYGHEPWHGDGGPIPSNRYLDVPLTDAAEVAATAAVRAGFAPVDDHNAPGAVGVGRMPMSSIDGRRVTTLDAYLPVGGMPSSLTIRCDALVDSVVIDGGRASGVRLADGTVARADRVVLCAGVYASPLVLLRSGIGAPEALQAFDRPVVADLPGVGANLADHPACYVECGSLASERSEPALHVMATFRSSTQPSADTPDVMLWMADPAEAGGAETSVDIDVVLLRPTTRGRVRLRSLDPAAPPVVQLPPADREEDLRRLEEGYRRAVAIANDAAVRRICAGSPVAELTPIEFRGFVAVEGYSVPHTVGTCAMGPRPEDGAVVDATLAVHGVAGLSVVDASVIPDAVSGFTHLPTIMIAEAFSDRIDR
jgi:choline dehydrogenase